MCSILVALYCLPCIALLYNLSCSQAVHTDQHLIPPSLRLVIQQHHPTALLSSFAQQPWLLQAGARYAEGLLKALGVQQAILVGHSAGALTAMELFKRCVHRLFALQVVGCCWQLHTHLYVVTTVQFAAEVSHHSAAY